MSVSRQLRRQGLPRGATIVAPTARPKTLRAVTRRARRQYRLVITGVLCLMVSMAIQAGAQGQDIAEGQALYQESCSTCHGLIAAEDAKRRFMPPEWPYVRVAILSSGRTGELMAVAPPYGPPLRGVYGRPAGSVPNFVYSRAFKKVLQGIVWDSQTLDRWIADSQAWVPGSLMFYTQPDAEMRRKIITYLQANR